MFIKSFLLVIIITLVAFLGLLGISTSFITNTNSEKLPKPVQKIDSTSEAVSNSFQDISHRINNSVIDYNSIEVEIKRVPEKLQRIYLNSLLEFRKQNYKMVYDNLLTGLQEIPSFAEYYELLAKSAKILDKTDELKIKINSCLNQHQMELNFASGLIDFHNVNINSAIEHFITASGYENHFKENNYWLGNSYRVKGDYENGIKILNELKSSLDSSDYFLSSVEISIGTIYFFSSDYAEAEKSYNAALNSAKINSNTTDEIKAIGNLAIIKDIYGQVDTARNMLSSLLLVAEKLENIEQLAFLYSELGVSYSYTNELIDARKNYLKSLELYNKLKNDERLAYLSGNIASIYMQQSNYREALNYYQKGIDYCGDNIFGKILNISGIADVYANLSNYSKALEYYKQADDLADSIKSAFAKSKVKVEIGTLFLNVNRPIKALDFFNEANKLMNIDEYPFDAAEMYYLMGVTYIQTKNYVEAERIIKKGLDIALKAGYTYYNFVLQTELANLYYLKNELQEAQAILTELLLQSEENSLTQLQGVQALYLAKVYAKIGRKNEGLKLLEKAYELSGSVSDFNNQIEAGSMIADFYVEAGNDSNAIFWFEKVAGMIDKLSPSLSANHQIQISHFSGVEHIFENMISFYLSLGRDEDAFNTLERYRSRNTVQNLANLKLLSADISDSLVNSYLDLKWQVNSGLYDEKEQAGLINKLRLLSEKIAGNNQHLVNILTSNPWLDYNSIKSNLDDTEKLVSIFTTDNYTQLFLATENELKSFRVTVSRDSLVALLKAIAPIYQTFSVNNEVFVNQDLFSFNAYAAYKFYDVLLSRVLENIPAENNLIFSLPQEFLVLPFEFLVTNWSNDDSPYYYKDKNFLIKKYPISYTPSVSVYINQKLRNEQSDAKNLLVGDPKIPDNELKLSYRGGMITDDNYSLRNLELFPLEFSEDEITKIDNLISNGKVLLSDQATETNFKADAPNSNLIHISSHSFLFNSQPLILLSQSNDKINDGFLEIGEIVQMSLKSNLVVLSSCRSGLGEIDEAEGTLGMQKAFFDAGAASVVVSLWDVNDKYTSIFMKEFYEKLSDGKTKTEALRETKLDFVKNYSPNPYYWSAFILSGNISSIDLQKSGGNFLLYLLLLVILIGIVLSGFIIFRKTKSVR